MADVKWIKLTTDMFDNRKIRALRRLPDGNCIVLIWVMLLTMAGRCNAGGMIFLTENIAYTPKMLADELDFEENTVLLALEALERFDMITRDEGRLVVAGWEEYQNLEGLDKIREQTRQRVAKYRENQRGLPAPGGNVTCNVTVTHGNATDKELEEEIRNKNNIPPTPPEGEREDGRKQVFADVIAYLNEKAGTKYRANSDKTRKHINARLDNGFTLEDFKTVIDKKCAEWLGTDYEKFLRPETLFGTKFEGYLNQRMTMKKSSQVRPRQTDLDDLF